MAFPLVSSLFEGWNMIGHPYILFVFFEKIFCFLFNYEHACTSPSRDAHLPSVLSKKGGYPFGSWLFKVPMHVYAMGRHG